MKFSKILPSAGILALFLSGPAFAQEDAAIAEGEELVVTGTAIRGIAAAGSNVVGISHEDIRASGALSTNEVLSELPFAQNFFNTVTQPGAGPGTNATSFVPLPRVQLRPLPGQNTGSNMQTLILVDGHRMAPMGVSTGGAAKVFVDSNMLPPGMLERVEVITDGGSAIYGSDAVTGVINYITRRRFDGVEVTGNYGVADGYERWGHGVTAGIDWTSGSLFGTYNYAQSDALFGRDRGWIRNYSTPYHQCDEPIVTVTPTSPTDADITCDQTDDRSYAPRTYSYSFAGGFSQDLSDTVRFDLRGIIARGVSISNNGAFVGPVTLQSTNAYFDPARGSGATPQIVSFSYAPALGNDSAKLNTTEDYWQITPELTWDFANDWQFRGFISHAETELALNIHQINQTARNLALSSPDPLVAINPYDIAATNPAALAALMQNFGGVGQTHFTNARAIVDGPLFTLPGGEVRAALGLEASETTFRLTNTGANDSTFGPESNYGQDVAARFAELQVPLISPEMNVFLVHSLRIQGSVRHDTYNDFGDTTNSAYGLTYEPVEWVSIFGNFSESFVAPTAIEQASAGQASFDDDPQVYQLPDNSLSTNPLITIAGTISPLRPQTSDSYTVGFEVRPPIVDGLTIRASFWHTLLMGRLGTPFRVAANQANNGFFNVFGSGDITPEGGGGFWIEDPTGAQILEIAQAFGDQDAIDGVLAPYIAGTQQADAIYDNRQRNLGRNLVEGWDLGFDYVHETSWGSWDTKLSATVFNINRQQVAPGSPYIEQQNETQAGYRASLSAGANVGNLRAQGTLNYSDGMTLAAGEIDAYHPLDLFFGYDLEGAGLTEDLTFTLNVNNVFDEEPPGLELVGVSGANGFTLGRLVQFGVSKRF